LVVAHDKVPGHEWALPGTFLHEGERLADAVLRSLREKAHVSGREPQQLHVFDDPKRDPRGWVLSVAHVDVVPLKDLEAALAGSDVKVLPLTGATPGLPYDHPAIVAKAVEQTRTAYAAEPDPGGLLTGAFTLRDLRMLHETVMGEALMRDTFRRFMEPKLVPTGAMSDGGRGRPSRLFQRTRR
jgi:ADP-ribose pyrophosphatase YjhB (NUDIX family)